MTRLIVESDNSWARDRIKEVIQSETALLRKSLLRTREKLKEFETSYGKFEGDSLFDKVDDMLLIEWEGEIETEKRLSEKVSSLEEITFEYR